ncbi:glycosyltransferase family 2 protein [Rubinisphaera brasiliensis]|uniref:Glycosyl transferase family 2 n=1 Tax=Rubinisphaera brasiliensis (strain ATCC 49424 / DSM 5305 / JCM 21570 / IAM 15109 / NBRC 103401 / IFAM 1448) TaxID=756272 RepID=F0SIW8_RUBBR|nr:glycosyltransferase [Rubinisphaera brasiliensis]ADY61817.1 glycosyl transferase family 2 [Rubinisphaera brasiliensis DSM 5305]
MELTGTPAAITLQETSRAAEPAVDRQQPPMILSTIIFVSTILFGGIALCLWYVRFAEWLGEHAQNFSTFYRFMIITVSICWALMLARWAFLISVSYLQLFRDSRTPTPNIAEWPHVSVLIPAYNEEETITPALASLKKLDYPHFDVAVIDDGSKDKTYELASQFAAAHPELNISVYRKPNGGKWSAHNFGFQRTRGELLLCLDADSRLRPQSLKLLVARLVDGNVAGVSGQVSVRNRNNLLTYLQSLEYLMANGALRLAQSFFGQVLVVPGPIGLFRRSVLEDVYFRFTSSDKQLGPGEYAGPFEGDTFAEDFDLSVAILSLGHAIVYEPAAVSDTKAPDSLLVLLNQRYRWSRGSLQVIRKYVSRLRRGEMKFQPGLFSWLCFCYLLEIAMFPFVYGMGIISLTPFLMYPATFNLMMTGTLLIWGLNASIAGLYVAVHRDRWRLISAVPFLDLYFGLCLSAGLVYSLVDECRNTRMKW